MNPDLVAQITRLVMEKLIESDNSKLFSLSSAEINRWNEISASMQRTTNNSSNGTNEHMYALSTAEIRSWNEITDRMNKRSHQTSESAAEIKLYSHAIKQD